MDISEIRLSGGICLAAKAGHNVTSKWAGADALHVARFPAPYLSLPSVRALG